MLIGVDKAMKKQFISLVITFVLIITVFVGCINKEGSIVIKGKGSFNSIQDAIDSASNYDTIIVYKGVYKETITIDKSISLVAVNKKSATISYPENETEMSIIKINEDNCSIDGFIIIGYNSSIQLRGIEVTSSNNTIKNNTIQYTYYGIYQENSNNNTISNNMIYNTDTGLSMKYSNNNKILSNNLSRNYEYGIYAQYQSNNNIFNLNILLENANGIRLKSSQKNTIEKNIINNSSQMGIYLCCGARDNIIFNNSLINNNPNADDHYDNLWYYNNVGNYWDDYKDKYPDVIDENSDGFWDTPYILYQDTKDLFPLVKSIKI